MTPAEIPLRDAMITAAREMLTDASDEAAAVSMVATQASEALDDGELLQALGTLTGIDAQLDALRHAIEAARTLLLRARAKGGA